MLSKAYNEYTSLSELVKGVPNLVTFPGLERATR